MLQSEHPGQSLGPDADVRQELALQPTRRGRIARQVAHGHARTRRQAADRLGHFGVGRAEVREEIALDQLNTPASRPNCNLVGRVVRR